MQPSTAFSRFFRRRAMGERPRLRLPLWVVLNAPVVLILLLSAGLLAYLGLENGARTAHDWWIIVALSPASYTSSINAHISAMLLLIGASLVISVVSLTLVLRRITQPIRRMTQASKAFAAGDWSERVTVNRGDELGELATAFNQMADQLQQSTSLLQANAARLRAIFENSAEAIVVTSMRGFATYNPAFQTLFGYGEDEDLTGKQALDVIAPGERPRIEEFGQLRLRGEAAPLAYETRGLRKDGSEFDMDLRVSTYVQDGELFTLTLLRDITERKRAEQALIDSEQRFRSITEAAPFGIGFAREGITLFANSRYLEMFGLESVEEVQGRPVIEQIAPQKREMIADFVRRRARGEAAPTEYETIGLRKDGSQFPYAVWVASVTFADGLANVGFFLDVTQRKQAEAALADQTRQLSERVKELTCLYQYSTFLEQSDGSLEAIYQGTVDLLPAAWQYSETTCARLMLEGRTYATSNFRETPWRQTSAVVVDEVAIGVLEVFYLEPQRVDFEGPFMKEERLLLDELARRLALKIGAVKADSERQRTQEALRRSQAMLEAALSNMQYPIHVSVAGRIVIANQAAAEMLGYDRLDDLVGRHVVDTIAPVEQARIGDYVARRSAGLPAPTFYLTRGMRHDGSEFDMNVVISTYTMDDEIYTLAALKDVTEEMRLQKAEQDQRRLAEALLDAALAITSSLDRTVVMRRILQNLRQVVPHDASNIMLPEGDVGHVIYWDGYPPETVPDLESIAFPLSMPYIRGMLKAGEPLIVHDTATLEDWVTLPGAKHYRSYVGVPIIAHETVVGILSMDSYEPAAFANLTTKPLMAFARLAAIAMENARLYDELHQYTQELERRVEERTAELQQAKDYV
jgi:PAS domain S-box-containing protein